MLPGTETEFLSEIDELLGPHIDREFVAKQPPVHASVDSPWFTAMADALRRVLPSEEFEFVRAGLRELRQFGGGAKRQRLTFARNHSLADVVDDLARHACH